MIDNLENILKNNLLVFEKEVDFFFVQIFKRRKDNPNLEYPTIRLKSYCIYSVGELKNIYPKIIKQCNENNVRAYIRLNKQDALDVSLRCIERISKNIRENITTNNRNVWDSISGQGGSKDYWVLDIDWEHIQENALIEQEIKNLLQHHFDEQRKETLLYIKNITKTGFHLIIKPFDTRILKKINKKFSTKGISTIQNQKDANTLIYTP